MLSVIYQHTKWHTHKYHDSFEADLRRSKRGQWPNSWKSPAILQNSWNNLLIHWTMRLSIPIKPKNPVTWGLSPSERSHTLWSVSLSQPAFTFCVLFLNSFLPKPRTYTWHHSRDMAWDVTILLCPTFLSWNTLSLILELSDIRAVTGHRSADPRDVLGEGAVIMFNQDLFARAANSLLRPDSSKSALGTSLLASCA